MKPLKLAQQFLLNQPRFSVLLNRAAGLLVFAVTVVILMEIFTPSSSQATLPVVDVAAVGQLIQQTQQYAQHLSMMAQQILLLKQQVESLRGHYGFGSLVGGPVNGWGTSSWEDVVGMVNTGVNPGDAAQVYAYKAARAKYISGYPPLDPSLQTTNPRMQPTYARTYQSAITGLSAGESTFNSLPGHLADLQTYKDKIEHTDTVKAALDLNTAVGIKNAQINAELLRTNAVTLYVQANAQNTLSSGRAAEADFFAN